MAFRDTNAYPRFGDHVLSVDRRSVTAAAIDFTADHLVVRGTYEDLHHLITIDLTIENDTRKVIKVSASMPHYPYDPCPETLRLLDGIVGVKLGLGVSKLIGEILGGASGCVHLVQIVRDSANFSLTILGYRDYPRLQQEGDNQEEIRKEFAARFPDTCHAYRREDRRET